VSCCATSLVCVLLASNTLRHQHAPLWLTIINSDSTAIGQVFNLLSGHVSSDPGSLLEWLSTAVIHRCSYSPWRHQDLRPHTRHGDPTQQRLAHQEINEHHATRPTLQHWELRVRSRRSCLNWTIFDPQFGLDCSFQRLTEPEETNRLPRNPPTNVWQQEGPCLDGRATKRVPSQCML
jgi:hypothetical protein